MITTITYEQFLANKALSVPTAGFSCPDSELHPSALPHQGMIIPWAIKGARRAIFAAFGLGKTHMQLEIARIISNYEEGQRVRGRKFLIICPLGTRQEFKEESKRLGIEVTYVKNRKELKAAPTHIVVTNYDRVRDGDIMEAVKSGEIMGVSLDEASALRSSGSKTYIEFNRNFQHVQYRYVCTATPSPNDYVELLNYASFLGIMDISQAKTRFFKRDSQEADKLTLYPHKEREFWMWVSSWAVFITKPSVLGFSDEGYDLPELDIRYHCVPSPRRKKGEDGQLKIISDSARGLSEAMKEKKASIHDRLDKAKEILAESPDDHYILWHHLESERSAIEKEILPLFPTHIGGGGYTIYGKQKEDIKEDLILRFAHGEYQLMATKPDIAGSGCNFQHHCHRAIFLGIDYKFNDFLQAIHRILRFQQKYQVRIDVIYTEAEDHILRELLRKWKQHNKEVAMMESIIREYGLSTGGVKELGRYLFTDRKEEKGRNFTAINNDNVPEARKIADNSIKLHFTSIPFATQYEYTPTYNDFGHNLDKREFFNQMDYLVPEMFRTLEPGRICLVHCKDRIIFGNYSGLGFPTNDRFSHNVADCFEKHGFETLGWHTIETDVVRENKQTRRLGWSECCKDATKMGCGSPEYLYVFRKPPTDQSNGYADLPVFKDQSVFSRGWWQIDAHHIWRSNGNRLLTQGEIDSLPLDKIMSWWKAYNRNSIYNYDDHVRFADALVEVGKLPKTWMAVPPQTNDPAIWTNIVRMRSLNTNLGQRMVEKHICPLPFDIVKRGIILYSNPGELVADFFGGVMTVPYVALEEGRQALAIELNDISYKAGVEFLRALEHKQSLPTLFDLIHYEDSSALTSVKKNQKHMVS